MSVVMFKTQILLFAVLVIAGCTSTPEKPKQYFSTNVTEEGVKQFALTIVLEDRKKRNLDPSQLKKKRGRGDKGRNREGDVKPNQSGREEKMLKMLDMHLARSEFCSFGYEITEQYQREGSFNIRGQCNETAK